MTAPLATLIQVFPVRIPDGFEPHAYGPRSNATCDRDCDGGSYRPGWGRMFPTPTRSGPHHAVDIAAAYGAYVVATCPGTVFTQWDYPRGNPRLRDGAGFLPSVGGYVRVQGPENYVIYYSHIRPVYVHPGDTIRTGDLLGHVYHSGTRGGRPHLHYAIRAPYPLNLSNGGTAIDPTDRLVALKDTEYLGWRIPMSPLLENPYYSQTDDGRSRPIPELMPNPYGGRPRLSPH